MNRRRTLALVALTGLLVSTVVAEELPRVPREQWGGALVNVSRSPGTWFIKGRRNQVSLDEATLAMTVKAGPASWTLAPSSPDDLLVRAQGEDFTLALSDAGKIEIMPYDTGALTVGGSENLQAQDQSAQRTAWMRQARWGVMTHFLADWQARTNKIEMSVEEWNRLVDGFDVEGLAEQIKSVGAGYHILTIGQNSGYYLAPNETYDRLVGVKPSRCSRRDLVSDMSAALARRGIKLIVYLPSGAPAGDRVAREALQWRDGMHPNKEFQAKWEEIIRDWSVRFGEKIAGWWFDGCYWPNLMYRSAQPPNFASFAAAARAGNANSAVAFNPGVVPRLISMTPEEDYTAGEISNPERLEIRRAQGGLLDGRQIQVLTYLGRTWGIGEPRFTEDQAIGFSRLVWREGGVVTWDVPVGLNGVIPEPFIAQLKSIGRASSEPLPSRSSGPEQDKWFALSVDRDPGPHHNLPLGR